MSSKLTIKGAMRAYMREGGHLYPADAVRLDTDENGHHTWVMDRKTGEPIKLFTTRARAQEAVRKASFQVADEFAVGSDENPLDDSSVLLIGAGVVLLGAIGYFVYRQQGPNPLLTIAAG